MGHDGAGTEDGQPGQAPADDFRRENREGAQDPSRDHRGDPLRARQAQSQRTRAQRSQGLPGGPAGAGASSPAQSRRPLSQVLQGQTLPVHDSGPAGPHRGPAHLPRNGLRIGTASLCSVRSPLHRARSPGGWTGQIRSERRHHAGADALRGRPADVSDRQMAKSFRGSFAGLNTVGTD